MHILTRTDPDAPKHRGITYFLLDMTTPGISIRPLITMAGSHHFNEVTFDNVRVPKKNMLGEKNRGWYAAMSALDFERSGIEYPARAKTVYEDVTRYAEETRVNGKTLIDDPSVKGKLSEAAIDIEVSRLLCYRIAWMQGAGLVPNHEASIGKLYGSEMWIRVANTFTHILGLGGQLHEGSKYAAGRRCPTSRCLLRSEVPDFYLNVVAGAIYSGTSEVQRGIMQRASGAGAASGDVGGRPSDIEWCKELKGRVLGS